MVSFVRRFWILMVTGFVEGCALKPKGFDRLSHGYISDGHYGSAVTELLEVSAFKSTGSATGILNGR